MGSKSSNQALHAHRLLAGKEILLIGTTGFLAKVMLSMLVERFSIGRLYCLVRPRRSKSAPERFWDEVMGSEMMEPLRARMGPAFDNYIREKIEVVAGDISKPRLGLDDETITRLQKSVDLVINSAGLVTFNPPLDDALEVNSVGAMECAEFTAGCDHAALVHVSTCYVAGNKSGLIREDVPIVGYYPRKGETPGVSFEWSREISDLRRTIEQIKGRKDDAALEARFRKEALDRLKAEGREPQPRTVRAAITNARRRWTADELIRIGIERAEHWGWPNIYTYTKALGEQAIAACEGLRWSIVRPAIVESAFEYPFPGWNEGMNTSAPLAYLGSRGHIAIPAGDDLILDVVPVDAVASATIGACAALSAGEDGQVYQVAAGDINPASMGRAVTLVGLHRRRKLKKEEADGEVDWLQARLREKVMPLPTSMKTYQRYSAPRLKSMTRRARKFLESKEPERYGPFGGLLSQAQKTARRAETDLGKLTDVFDLFEPFVVKNRYVFRTANTRGLFSRMNEADQALLPYAVERMDWRHYWLDVHLPGLERWVFPKMEVGGPKRTPIPRSYRDLAEMFESRTEEHARRVAFRLLRKDHVADSYSYRDVRRASEAVARYLMAQGIGRGDRVMLASESRPEWGMTYFGIILSGATAIPVDIELSSEEITNIARASQAKLVVCSDDLLADLADAELGAPMVGFDAVFEDADVSNGVARLDRPRRKPEDIASILFTSGTTGTPKGVMLTDRNFTALTARIAALFDLRRTDSLLSVLPLHHTFEFSGGLLFPVNAGASITYLEERTPELLQRAFRETPVTAMIGVPAVWEALHRKIFNQVSELPGAVEATIRGLMRLNYLLRDHSPWNIGRWIFRPMHDALGGRVRFLVSGGAPLKTDLYKDFRGLGFSLYEGYGLTEAAPVISVSRPRGKTPAGSVGLPLPGIEVRIDGADDVGVGEVIARGPTIMAGYLDNPEATSSTVRNGWLHTGDRGRVDDDGRLFIVGREKDVIIDTGGKNVYPDEIESMYSGCDHVKELSVVGIPAEHGTGERVACVVVPDYEFTPADAEEDLTREQVRERIREYFKDVGAKQPIARRVKVLHLWDEELPRTSTRKIKRPFVRDLLMRLERNRRSAHQEGAGGLKKHWVHRTVATICERDLELVVDGSRLVDDLGFDSLMQLELLNAVEDEFPDARVSQEEMAAVETVHDVVALTGRDRSNEADQTVEVGNREETPIEVPSVVASMGKSMLGWAQRQTYDRLFDVEVRGRSNIPANANFIIAANHASHLDMGLVKYAMDGLAGEMMTLAAKDYFFDDPLRRVYFENFTNLLPMDRHGSLKKSLRMATKALRRGRCLLVFPEGTRARDGVMISFKPAIGYLSLNERVDILPVYLGGTHDALPVGASVPKDRKLVVKIAPPVSADAMRKLTEGWPRAQAYRHVTELAETAVRRLGGLEPLDAPEPAASASTASEGAPDTSDPADVADRADEERA